MNMARVVFDASAVIALLRNEPGADLVGSHAGEALMSAANLQEVVKALLVRGIPLAVAKDLVASLHIDVRPHEIEDAYAAAALHTATSVYGSGLGDRTCMALGIREGLPVVTTDRDWGRLAIPGLTVTLAR